MHTLRSALVVLAGSLRVGFAQHTCQVEVDHGIGQGAAGARLSNGLWPQAAWVLDLATVKVPDEVIDAAGALQVLIFACQTID